MGMRQWKELEGEKSSSVAMPGHMRMAGFELVTTGLRVM